MNRSKKFNSVDRQGDDLDKVLSFYRSGDEAGLVQFFGSMSLEQLRDLEITALAVASLMGGLVERFDLLNVAGILDSLRPLKKVG